MFGVNQLTLTLWVNALCACKCVCKREMLRSLGGGHINPFTNPMIDSFCHCFPTLSVFPRHQSVTNLFTFNRCWSFMASRFPITSLLICLLIRNKFGTELRTCSYGLCVTKSYILNRKGNFFFNFTTNQALELNTERTSSN